MTSVAVVDYGAGNTRSVLRALRAAGADDPVLSDDPAVLLAADRLVLPGVGAAGAAMDGLRARNLVEVLDEAVTRRAKPLLGICVGMQIMAERLFEFGEHRGLGWIKGDVVSLDDLVQDRDVRVPHMGWNQIQPREGGPLVTPRSEMSIYYFAHSFAVRPADISCIEATVVCGTQICVGIRTGSVLGVQFHPEKSQINGIRLLTSFLGWRP